MSFYGSMKSSVKSRRKQDCFVDLNLMLHFQVYKLHGGKSRHIPPEKMEKDIEIQKW